MICSSGEKKNQRNAPDDLFIADQHTCGGIAANNNTYFVNPQYPELWSGGSSYVIYTLFFYCNIVKQLISIAFSHYRCTLTVHPCSSTVCQLRIEFLDLSLVGPSGDGNCNTDAITITGGATNVPVLCGENSGQHVVVDFDDENPISITIAATSQYTFGRHWFIRATQFNCDSANKGWTLRRIFQCYYSMLLNFFCFLLLFSLDLNSPIRLSTVSFKRIGSCTKF